MNQDIKTYRTLNLIFAGIIIGVFLYSGIFSYKKSNYPIPSAYTNFTGKKAISTGLSRSFSAIMRLEINTARNYNPFGVSIFVFFLTQLFLRFFFYFSVSKSFFELSQIITLDIIISVSLFLLHFKPFFKDLFYR